MVFFKKKKEREVNPEDVVQGEEVLAYFEEILRLKAPIDLYGTSGSYETTPVTVDEHGGRVRLLGSLPRSAKDVKRGGVSLDRTYWIFGTRVMSDGGKMFFSLPNSLHRKDRRRNPRTNFTRREEVKVTILQGLGTGIGFLGQAINISMNGLLLYVKNAMNLENESPIQAHPGIIQPGSDLMMIRIAGVPGIPQMEFSGKVVRLTRDGGVKLAVTFKPSGSYVAALKKFIDGRQVEFRRTRRMRRKPEEGEDLQRTLSPEEKSDNQHEQKKVEPDKTSQHHPPSNGSESVENHELGSEVNSSPAPEPTVTQTVMVIGKGIERWVAYEFNNDDYAWISPSSLESVIQEIQAFRPKWILFEPQFFDVDGIEFLIQLKSTGILGEAKLALLGKSLTVKDKVRSRMLQIQAALEFDELTADLMLQLLTGHRIDI